MGAARSRKRRRDERRKPCAGCGRDFAWRRKWTSCWDQVRYCSARCRQRRRRRIDEALEEAIRVLLQPRSGSICPSEAARRVDPVNWRDLMDRTRAAGRRLAQRSQIVVLQRGRPVAPTSAAGPIRFGRGGRFSP